MTLQVHSAQALDITQARQVETHHFGKVCGVCDEFFHFIVGGCGVQWRTLIPTAPIQFH
ncbi:hypothetical protein D3C84_1307180 [compost metagenome]